MAINAKEKTKSIFEKQKTFLFLAAEICVFPTDNSIAENIAKIQSLDN